MATDAVFTALADGTRREVLVALADHGPCTATALASGMPITRQAVAKHLTHLHRAGLVVPERQGRETRYRLTPDALSEATGWLDEVCARARRQAAA
jgi:DNA-binding transcriptional ArsR family regulator